MFEHSPEYVRTLLPVSRATRSAGNLTRISTAQRAALSEFGPNIPVLYPASHYSDSADSFVSLQGKGKRIGSLAPWRQWGRWQNRQCCHCNDWPDGALVKYRGIAV